MDYLIFFLLNFGLFFLINIQYFISKKSKLHYENLLFLIYINACLLWMCAFFFFYILPDIKIALLLSHLNYFTSIIIIYSLLGYIYFFDSHKKIKFNWVGFFLILGLIILLGCLYFSSAITASMDLDDLGIYREKPGKFAFIHLILSLIGVIGVCILAINKYQTLRSLPAVRFLHILIASAIVIIVFLFFQLLLPTFFNIWLFEKELVFVSLMYIYYINHVVHKYYFGFIYQSFIGLIIICVSIILTAMLVEYLSINIRTVTGIYWASDHFNIFTATILTIIVYYSIHTVLASMLVGKNYKNNLKNELLKIEEEMIDIPNFDLLQKFLSKKIGGIFHTKFVSLIRFQDEIVFRNTRGYFEFGFKDNIFLNDGVFIESHKRYPNIYAIVGELPKNTHIVYPLMYKKHCIGILILGYKSLDNFYQQIEIQSLKSFTLFLSSHIRYLDTYTQLQDLTLNLDKKVDEKTIDYNNLINRQKEFIAMISHEVRSPMSAAIFQSESLLQSLDIVEFSKEKFRTNLHTLSEQLVRMGGIISKLFSVHYYENNSVNLFLERIQFAKFLEYEIDLFARIESDITVIKDIDEAIGFIKIDKIQFQQVLTNLLDNAKKFAPTEDAIIAITARHKMHGIELIIEDNGVGFEGIDITRIFDIYTTGSSKNKGLGMGLYLCQKIITMHGGTIKASVSKKYGGACFMILLPFSSR